MTSETPKLSTFQLRHRQGQRVTRPAVSFRSGRIKDRTRETAEIEPKLIWARYHGKIQRSRPLRDSMCNSMSEIAQHYLINPAWKLNIKLNEFALFRNFLFSVIFYILELSLRVVYKKSVDGASVRQEAFVSECQLIWVAQTHEQGSHKNIRSLYGYVTLSALTYTEANQARGWYSFAVVCLEREGLGGYKDKVQ